MHHFYLQLMAASDREADKWGKCGKYLKCHSRMRFSLKVFAISCMCLYLLAEIAFGIAVFQTITYHNQKRSVIVNALVVAFEFGLLIATGISMRYWYFRMKDKPPSAVYLLKEGDYDSIFRALKKQCGCLMLLVIAFDLYITITAKFSSLIFISVYVCSLCNVLCKDVLLAVITTDTQASLRLIDNFRTSTMSNSGTYNVEQYLSIRSAILDISNRALYLYLPSTGLVAIELVGAFVLLFLPFEMEYWIVFVLLITVELLFNIFAVQQISLVNEASEKLSEIILEPFSYSLCSYSNDTGVDSHDPDSSIALLVADKQVSEIGTKKLFPEDVESQPHRKADNTNDTCAHDVNGTSECKHPLNVEKEMARLSLSVICLSKPIVFTSLGIVWTDTKWKYQILVSLSSFALYMGKFVFGV